MRIDILKNECNVLEAKIPVPPDTTKLKKLEKIVMQTSWDSPENPELTRIHQRISSLTKKIDRLQNENIDLENKIKDFLNSK